MNVSLPETMRAWVEDQIARSGYGTASEYFRHLIREEQKRQLREEIDAKLLAALDSGDATPMTKDDWNRLKEEARQRWAKRHSA